MFRFGYFDLREWRYEGTALIVCALVWSVTGPAVFGSAVWVLVSIGRSWLPLSIGGLAIAVSVQFWQSLRRRGSCRAMVPLDCAENSFPAEVKS